MYSTHDQQYQVFSDAILECSFAGHPAPEIVWRTPHGIILRHNENVKPDPSAKFQLSLGHSSISEDTIDGIEYKKMIERETESDSLSARIRKGPGITLWEKSYLKVHNISRTDSGLYTCFAINIMGNATKDIR
jgi:Immunoglobulin domain